MEGLRLPRKIMEEPGAQRFADELAACSRPLWADSELGVPHLDVSEDVVTVLRSVQSSGRIVRGMEGAERTLAAEDRGLKHADRSSGVERGGRVSRLLVLANDGSERFYHDVEALLRRHWPRVLALRLAMDEKDLGEMLYGPDQRARLILVEHKSSVSAVLLALAARWESSGEESP
ncbi:MAG: hypothetical protein ACI8TX_001718 [Hyphomicrobiaceae bacterium]|jgi:hypothetical protein